MATDDLTPLLGQPAEPALKFHQGLITEWNNQTGENAVKVKGTTLRNVPMLNLTEALVMRAGLVVGMLSAGTQWWILGRITVPGDAQFFLGGQPDITVSFHQLNADAAMQSTAVDTSWYPKFIGALRIRHTSATFGGRSTWLAGGTGRWRVAWYTIPPGTAPDPPGGTVMFTSATNTVGVQGSTYVWPAGMRDQLVYVTWEVQQTAGTAGTTWHAVSPSYFLAHD